MATLKHKDGVESIIYKSESPGIARVANFIQLELLPFQQQGWAKA